MRPLCMPYSKFCGIDPGKNGAIALIGPDNLGVEVFKMPPTDLDLMAILSEIVTEIRFCVIEDITASIPGKLRGSHSASVLIESYGSLRTLLKVVGIPFDRVSARKWQTLLGCLSHGKKAITKARAQELFPGVPGITNQTADSILLAEYCRRTYVPPAINPEETKECRR